MRCVICSRASSVNGTVVIGEGEKDEAPMLYNGEVIGDGTGAEVDVAVDPIDGTGLTSRGQGNAVSVVALSERGTMFDPGPCVYMDKLVCGPEAADVVDLDAPPEENVYRVAKALGLKPAEVGVTILDRPRHEELVASIRSAGARVYLITDGDVGGQHQRRSRRNRRPPPDGHRRNAGGSYLRLRREMPRRPHVGPALAA